MQFGGKRPKNGRKKIFRGKQTTTDITATFLDVKVLI